MATARHRVALAEPVATAPAEPAALARYAASAPWCAPYATRTRTAGALYCVLVALPVALACYGLARAIHWAVRAHGAWTPGTAGPSEGRRHRWLAAHCPRPPSLATAAARAHAAGIHPVATAAAMAVTACCYALAWVTARPGRAFAALLLLGIVWIFT